MGSRFWVDWIFEDENEDEYEDESFIPPIVLVLLLVLGSIRHVRGCYCMAGTVAIPTSKIL